MSLEIRKLDLERIGERPNMHGDPRPRYYVGGIELADGESTIRFKPTPEQLDQLWAQISPGILSWAKAMISEVPSDG